MLALGYEDGQSRLSYGSTPLQEFPYQTLATPLLEAIFEQFDIDPTLPHSWYWLPNQVDDHELLINIGYDTGAEACQIRLLLEPGSPFSIADIQSFAGIRPMEQQQYFTITALMDNGQQIEYVQLEGYSDCIPLGECTSDISEDWLMGGVENAATLGGASLALRLPLMDRGKKPDTAHSLGTSAGESIRTKTDFLPNEIQIAANPFFIAKLESNQDQLRTPLKSYIPSFYSPTDTLPEEPCTNPNLVQNGDFSEGNIGFFSAFQYRSECAGFGNTPGPGTGPEEYAIVDGTYNQNCQEPELLGLEDQGSSTGNFLLARDIFFVDDPDEKIIWQQNLDNIEPNTRYDFKIWISYLEGGSVDIALLVNEEIIATAVDLNQADLASWKPLSGSWHSGSQNSTEIAVIAIDRLRAKVFAIDDISFKKSCEELPPPPNPLCCLPEFPEIPIEDNCVDDLINIAEQNAQQMYEAYLQEVREQFQADYIAQCLMVYEDFHMTMEDTEHHYTLYYYDQAGNLVRTVPPQGVQKITDPAVLQQVKEDRSTRSRSVFTGHSYETTYRYNSLNQLVGQSMPDQEEMASCQFAGASSFLSNSHRINGLAFQDQENGFAYGSTVNGTSFIAVTSNGADSWQSIPLPFTGSISDMQLLDDGTAYLAGSNGLVAKKSSTLFWQPLSNVLIYDYHALHFLDAEQGYIVGDNGLASRTVNGGQSWIPFPLGTEDLNDVSFTADGSFGIVVGDNGTVYSFANHDWQEVALATTANLNAIHILNPAAVFIVGSEGQIWKGNLINGQWQKLDDNDQDWVSSAYSAAGFDIPGDRTLNDVYFL
ncbi:MAG: hypothetical protein AAGJ93_10040, partial [Bacteroidota bacterium]